MDQKFIIEKIKVSELKDHPKNYRKHPEDQIKHIIKSIEQHGIYRNIVIAKDNTILAGHGVVTAAKKLKINEVPVIRFNIDSDSPQALKLIIGDNEISKLAEVDDYELSNLLKEIKDIDLNELLGTGFDEKTFINLLMVSRPSSEIKDFNEAAEWIGLPDFIPVSGDIKVIVHFRNIEDRKKFFNLVKQKFTDKTTSIWYPEKNIQDINSLKFEEND